MTNQFEGFGKMGGCDTIAVMRLEPKDNKQKDLEISLIGGLLDRLFVDLFFEQNAFH